MAQTKVKLISDGVIVQGNLHASHGITTAHIGEGSNLYYTDARVGSYLSTNSFATESYVGTQITNLVDSSPATLNTLNELAAALGDDPNFATTTATSIGLKAPLASPSFTGNSTFAGPIYLLNTSARISAGGSGEVGFNYNTGATGSLVWYGGGTASKFNVTSAGNATFAGNISGVRGFFNSGATNVVATFTSTDGTATLQCADPTGNVEFGASGDNFVVQPAGGVAQLTVGAGSSVFAEQLGIGTSPGSNMLYVKGTTNGADITTRFAPFSNNASSTFFLSSVSSGDGGYFYNSNNNTSGLFSYGDYTFYVGTGNLSGGGPANPRMVIKQDGNIGIGTTSPAEKLEVSGSVKIGNLKIQNADGGRIGFNRNTATGAIYNSNYAAFQINGAYSGADYLEIQNYNSSGVFAGSAVLKNGNFGIGTTSPSYKLQVSSKTRLYNVAIGGTDGGLYNVYSDSVVGFNNLHLGSQGSGAVYVNSALARPMYINPVGGDVGIGTTTPGSILTVRKDAAGGRGGEISIVNYASNTVGNEAALNFGLESSTYHGDFGNAQIKARVNASNAASDMIFSTWNGTSFGERMRIESDGKIQVGSDKVIWAGGYGGGLVIRRNNATGDRLIKMVTVDSTGAIASDNVLVAKGTYVGINTESPEQRLHVVGKMKITDDIIFAQTNGRMDYDNGVSSGALRFFSTSGNTERMRITSAGRVGIGTTNPQAALDISSSYSIQGNVRTYMYAGTAAGLTNINLDITVGNEGGQGNVFKIEAGFAHYYAMTYNSIAEWWCTSRGTTVINTYILNAGTSFSGTWSASKPSTTVLRITKSAGTYSGSGKYWVKVTYVPF